MSKKVFSLDCMSYEFGTKWGLSVPVFSSTQNITLLQQKQSATCMRFFATLLMSSNPDELSHSLR